MGVGDMCNVPRGYRAAINDLEASRILEWREGELVMAGKVFVYECDSGGSAVDQGMSSNGLVAEGNIAEYDKMLSFHYCFRD
jgi:hypothetical protein